MHLLFSQEEGSEKYPFSLWTPGAYKFRLFLNQVDGRLGREVACLGPMQITDAILSAYKAGVGKSLCPSRQILVQSARPEPPRNTAVDGIGENGQSPETVLTDPQ